MELYCTCSVEYGWIGTPKVKGFYYVWVKGWTPKIGISHPGELFWVLLVEWLKVEYATWAYTLKLKLEPQIDHWDNEKDSVELLVGSPVGEQRTCGATKELRLIAHRTLQSATKIKILLVVLDGLLFDKIQQDMNTWAKTEVWQVWSLKLIMSNQLPGY